MLESGEIIKFLASFSIIVIFIYSVYYYISKSGFKLSPKSGKNIKILESFYFDKNRSFHLVKVKDTLFFVAFDEKGISKLKEWKEGNSEFKAESDESKKAEDGKEL